MKMKIPRFYALWISLPVALVVVITLVLNDLIQMKHTLGYFIVPGLFTAGFVFFMIRLYFIRFVEKKNDPNYKTPQSYTMSRKAHRPKFDKGKQISEQDKEVKVWADNQSEEIKKLKQTEKYRKDFLGNVSHELKTPIFNIQGYILTLLDGGIKDKSINELYLKRAERSTNRMINIVEDLDSIARLESGEFKLNMEVFNLAKVVEEVIEFQEMHARQPGIRISFEGTYSKPIRVRADKKRIMEVVGNLINNSIKYGKEGGRTTIGFLDNGENILVEVSDNGIGIEEKNLPRIFERFYRVDRSRSRESGGTGLGLSIVKHIIQAHNQTITVRSRVDQGTSFVFSLAKA